MDDFQWIKDIKMETDFRFPESWSAQKMSRTDIRRLKYLTSTYSLGYHPSFDTMMSVHNLVMNWREGRWTDSIDKKRKLEQREIFEIVDKNEIDYQDLFMVWDKQLKLRKSYRDQYKDDYGMKFRTPTKEGRDNKGIYIGNGGGHGNKVRYPSKKRSKRVWKMFYKMFPYCAERDGWDGKTSKRMKK